MVQPIKRLAVFVCACICLIGLVHAGESKQEKSQTSAFKSKAEQNTQENSQDIASDGTSDLYTGVVVFPEIREVDKYILNEQYKEAADLLFKLAKDGSPVAQFKLGVLYEYGLGVEQNYKTAMDWYYLSGVKGNYAKAQYKIGMLYLKRVSGLNQYCTNAKYFLKQAANRNVREASLALAEMYAKGITCNRDYNESLKWYRVAAEQGSAYAQNKMGDFYYSGVYGLVPSKSDALEWYSKAARQGNANATFSLALMRINGQGDKANIKEGCKLLDSLLNRADISNTLRRSVLEAKGQACFSDALK